MKTGHLNILLGSFEYAHGGFRVINQGCIPCLMSLTSRMGKLVEDLLHRPTGHSVQTRKCSQHTAKVTANERYSYSCYKVGKITMSKNGLRKKEDEILDLGLKKWIQFG